jgi:hypothetical protein
MGMTDKIMDKLHSRSTNSYQADSGVQHSGMMSKMKDSFSRLRSNRH